MNSSTVSAGNPGLASEYNNLRKDLIVQAGQYAVSTGSANAYLLSIDAQFVAYTAGDNFEFQANFANTGSATLNVNSVGAKTLKDPQGNTLGANAIPSGAIVKCVYNGTDLICYGGIIATTSNVGFSEMATDAEALAGTDETRYINSKQAKDNYGLIDSITLTRDVAAASGTVTYNHSLGKVPTFITIDSITTQNGSSLTTSSHGAWKTPTTNKCAYGSSAGAGGSVTATTSASFSVIGYATSTLETSGVIQNVTSTQFDIVWTKNGSPGAGQILAANVVLI